MNFHIWTIARLVLKLMQAACMDYRGNYIKDAAHPQVQFQARKLCAKEKHFSRLISIRSNMQGELGIGLLVGAVILILYMLYK